MSYDNAFADDDYVDSQQQQQQQYAGDEDHHHSPPARGTLNKSHQQRSKSPSGSVHHHSPTSTTTFIPAKSHGFMMNNSNGRLGDLNCIMNGGKGKAYSILATHAPKLQLIVQNLQEEKLFSAARFPFFAKFDESRAGFYFSPQSGESQRFHTEVTSQFFLDCDVLLVFLEKQVIASAQTIEKHLNCGVTNESLAKLARDACYLCGSFARMDWKNCRHPQNTNKALHLFNEKEQQELYDFSKRFDNIREIVIKTSSSKNFCMHADLKNTSLLPPTRASRSPENNARGSLGRSVAATAGSPKKNNNNNNKISEHLMKDVFSSLSVSPSAKNNNNSPKSVNKNNNRSVSSMGISSAGDETLKVKNTVNQQQRQQSQQSVAETNRDDFPSAARPEKKLSFGGRQSTIIGNEFLSQQQQDGIAGGGRGQAQQPASEKQKQISPPRSANVVADNAAVNESVTSTFSQSKLRPDFRDQEDNSFGDRQLTPNHKKRVMADENELKERSKDKDAALNKLLDHASSSQPIYSLPNNNNNNAKKVENQNDDDEDENADEQKKKEQQETNPNIKKKAETFEISPPKHKKGPPAALAARLAGKKAPAASSAATAAGKAATSRSSSKPPIVSGPAFKKPSAAAKSKFSDSDDQDKNEKESSSSNKPTFVGTPARQINRKRPGADGDGEDALVDENGHVFSPENVKVYNNMRPYEQQTVQQKRYWWMMSNPAFNGIMSQPFHRNHPRFFNPEDEGRITLVDPVKFFGRFLFFALAAWARPEEGYDNKTALLLMFLSILQVLSIFFFDEWRSVWFNMNKARVTYLRQREDGFVDPNLEDAYLQEEFWRYYHSRPETRRLYQEVEHRVQQLETEIVEHQPIRTVYPSNIPSIQQVRQNEMMWYRHLYRDEENNNNEQQDDNNNNNNNIQSQNRNNNNNNTARNWNNTGMNNSNNTYGRNNNNVPAGNFSENQPVGGGARTNTSTGGNATPMPVPKNATQLTKAQQMRLSANQAKYGTNNNSGKPPLAP